MELAHLKALIAVGDVASLERAGRLLHLSAPAIFSQLQLLELELGKKLYQRAGRTLILTAAGHTLVEYAKRIMIEHDRAIDAVRELSGITGGRLRLGCGPHMSAAMVPRLVQAFLAKYPGVDVAVTTGDDDALAENLRTGKVDVLLMNLPVSDRNFESESLWQYELVLVISPADPLAKRKTIFMKDVSSRTFIIYQRAAIIESSIRRHCEEIGLRPVSVIANDQADSIREMVKLGVGIAFLPTWSVSGDLQRKSLKAIRLPGGKLMAETGMVFRREAYRTSVLTAFSEVAQNWKNWLPQPNDVVRVSPEAVGI